MNPIRRSNSVRWQQAQLSRRTMLQAGSIGLMGLGMADVSAARAMAQHFQNTPDKSVIFVFLNGGISHQDSFDMKPEAPAEVRGEFRPIATRTAGLEICEHLPLLAQQSERFALVRSMASGSSGHEEACHMLFTGRLDFPAGFSLARVPSPNEWPSLASQITYLTQGRNQLPPAAVLPQVSVNEANAFRPGQWAGKLGAKYEAWHLHVAAACALGNGACPNCFRFEGTPFTHESSTIFDMPVLSLPEGGRGRLGNRVELLSSIENQQRRLEKGAESAKIDRNRQQAISVLADPRVQTAFDVENADLKTTDRYGKNKFGLSLLMARRLVEAGVNMVQVNLGKNSSWDTHRRNFPNLKDNLMPYMDRAVSGLLDDLAESGLLDDTLVVVTGEFGRTPKINPDGGRDHWGPVMTSLFAGAGVRGGTVIGATDKIAAQPVSDRHTIENLAATVLNTLGVPRDSQWIDFDGRPHEVYRGEPIVGLM
ncbi:MAG: DUF1501 domain-containing protein [Planctomycetota bacterium]|nr:DUF1501 domain-containing protein [Planctomycetota bacterium]